MKIKSLAVVMLLLLSAGLSSCGKDCSDSNPKCNDQPPTDEVCSAYFEMWFYNKKKKKCEMIAYSGCSGYGFATEADCEECECK